MVANRAVAVHEQLAGVALLQRMLCYTLVGQRIVVLVYSDCSRIVHHPEEFYTKVQQNSGIWKIDSPYL